MDYTGKVITKNPVTPTQVSAPGVWTLDEALQAQKGNNWPVPGVYNPISRSLRFNSADSAYLNRTPASAGNRKTWTWSGWVKRSTLSTLTSLETVQDGAAEDSIAFQSDDTIRVYMSPVAGNGTVTTAVLRDLSAWYHIVIAVDTTQATAANRTIIYVNNVNVTSSSSNYITQNSDTKFNGVFSHFLGRYANLTMPTGNFNGYMTEINFIDGQALTPSDFGLADPTTGVWVPKKYTGTYGTNGFYLNFKDNSNTTTIGYDYSGNSNNWNANNFSVTAGAGNDSLTDVPTLWIGYGTGDTGGVVRGNYATLNSAMPVLTNQATTALSNGNLDFSVTQTNSNFGVGLSTIGVSSGKWYFEYLVGNARNQTGVGFINAANLAAFNGSQYGFATPSDGWARVSNGYLQTNSTSPITTLSTFTDGDIVICAVDFDAGKMWFGKNGTWDSSGNPGAGTNELATFTPGGKTFVFGVQGWTSSGSITGSINFGQRPFSYTTPTGFKSLCTTNLPTPAIGTSSTTLADDYFSTVLYNGTGATLGVTGVGFQPDFVWIKSRSAATDHALYDVVRGDKNQLESNTTTAETNETTGLTGFNADGFTVGSLAQVNTNTATYVGWNWKAGGVGVTNTAGSITSTVSANTTAGFSIVTFTALSSGTGTIGHGLGVAPSMIIVKSRAAAYDWAVYHTSLGNTAALKFTTGAANTDSGWWNNTSPTSSVFTLSTLYNGAGNCVAYCFAEVAGYSAFGKYVGNGSADGPFVYLGFRPKWILIKPSDSADSWQIEDAARSPYNVVNDQLFPNASQAEQVDSATRQTDFLSNGFKLRGTNSGVNGSAVNYIYAAFAESPFKFANAR